MRTFSYLFLFKAKYNSFTGVESQSHIIGRKEHSFPIYLWVMAGCLSKDSHSFVRDYCFKYSHIYLYIVSLRVRAKILKNSGIDPGTLVIRDESEMERWQVYSYEASEERKEKSNPFF